VVADREVPLAAQPGPADGHRSPAPSEVFDLKPTSEESRNPVHSRACRASRNC
jgi:hypothetical protein